MGYKVIKMLMENNRKTRAELIKYCETYYKANMLNEAEYNELMAELEAEV